MSKQICPTCGCYIAGKGQEKEGVLYCCEACVEGSACTCGCCRPVETKPEVKKD